MRSGLYSVEQSPVIIGIALFSTIAYIVYFCIKVIPRYDDKKILVFTIVMGILGIVLSFFAPIIVTVTAIFLFLVSLHVLRKKSLLIGIIIYLIIIMYLLFNEAA